MATITWYVDTGNTTGPWDGTTLATAYQHLNDFNSNEVTNLITDGNSYIVECYATTEIADNISSYFTNSWVTDVDHTLTIKAGTGNEALKTGYDVTRYRIEGSNDYNGVLRANINYITIDGLQVSESIVSSQGNGIYFDNSTGKQYIKNCRVKCPSASGIGNGYGIVATDYADVDNCIVTGFKSGTSGLGGILGSGNINNCIAYGCYWGIRGVLATCTNCSSFNNDDEDFKGIFTSINYCASDDGDGTNPISPFGSDWTNEYENPANEDFTLLLEGNCFQGGIPISGLIFDIEGDAYHETTPSVGVDEQIVINVNNDVALFNVGNQLFAPSLEFENEIDIGVLKLGILLYNVTVETEIYHSDSFGNSDVTKSKLPGRPEIVNGKMAGKPEISGK